MRSYYVYIMSNTSRVLYVGVTNDLMRRVFEHQNRLTPGFTRKYNVHDLVWFEETSNVRSAIEREKQVKGWSRWKKLKLIGETNPAWMDLSRDWVP